MRSKYWSCTPFADWIRGTAKGSAKTGSGWNAWHKAAKKAYPIRYWIAEEGLDKLQSFIWWPIDRLYDIKYYINNRWVTRTHALTSTLKRGQWHEFDTRLLHCMFDELVNYVEVEEAWSNVSWDKEAREKYNAPFYSWGWFRWRTWRCPEAGIDKLKWAASLTNEEWLDEDKKHLAEPTHQANTAKELLFLYDWWKNVYPNRKDPNELSGWSDWCEGRRNRIKERDPDAELIAFLDTEDESEHEKEESRRILDLSSKIEQEQYDEDTEMMFRLIKIRRGMWT